MAVEAAEVTVPTGTARAAAWFFDNTLDLFVAVQGEILKATNSRWSGLTGWTSQEAVERSFFAFIHPHDEEAAREIVKELPVRERLVLDLRLLTKSGAWLLTEAQIVRGPDAWLLMILRDITAERQRETDAEEALHAAMMLHEMAGITIWRFDPDADEYDFDPDFTRSGRASRPYNLRKGAVVRSGIHPADAWILTVPWADSVATGACRMVSYRERNAAGDWRLVRATWRGIRRLASARWELLGITQDVSGLTEEAPAKKLKSGASPAR